MAANTLNHADYLAMAESLPQWKHVYRENFDRWLDAVLAAPPSSLTPQRHLERMAGLTGTQTPIVVLEARGLRDTFGGTIHSLVVEKLFGSLPQPQNDHMARGIQWEPYIRDIFHSYYGDAIQSDIEALIALQDVEKTSKDHPWLIGTPDDVVIIDGRRIIVDYKSPIEAKTKIIDGRIAPEIYPRYSVQLHHYELIGNMRGVDFDGRMLVFPDLERNRLVIHEVDRDESIFHDILCHGDRVWNDFVLKGLVPDPPERNITADIAKYAPNLRVLSEKMAIRKKLGETIENALEKDRAEMTSLLVLAGVTTGNVSAPGLAMPLSISMKEKPNVKALIDYFSEHKITLPMVLGKNFNEKRMAAELAYAGMRPEEVEKMSDHGMALALANMGIDPNTFREKEVDVAEALRILEELKVDSSPFLSSSLTVRDMTKGEGGELMQGISAKSEEVVSAMMAEMTSKEVTGFRL